MNTEQLKIALIEWHRAGRPIAFALASTSIWCLLADFYGLCRMQSFALYVLIPSTLSLIALAVFDKTRGAGQLWSCLVIGTIGGLLGALAYDLFRLPFVFARPLGISSIIPSMNLFKVFPRFGAMLLGQSIEQSSYSLAAHLLGLTYHFSNGVTFGIMYIALIGDGWRRSWMWGLLFATGLELAMLLTPYPRVFGIHITPTFIAVTLTAHAVFGACLGLLVRQMYGRIIRASC